MMVLSCLRPLPSNAVLLIVITAGLDLVGLAANVTFAASQGTSPIGATLFVTIRICIDLLEVVGLAAAIWLWLVKAGIMALLWIAV